MNSNYNYPPGVCTWDIDNQYEDIEEEDMEEEAEDFLTEEDMEDLFYQEEEDKNDD